MSSLAEAFGSTLLQDAYNSTPGLARAFMPQPGMFDDQMMQSQPQSQQPHQFHQSQQLQLQSQSQSQQQQLSMGMIVADSYGGGSTPLHNLQSQSQSQSQSQQRYGGQHQPKQQRQSQSQQSTQAQSAGDDTYVDKLWLRRRDVLKAVGLALVILLAITSFSLFDFWLKEHTAANQLSYRHELGLRALLPVVVLALLWNAKALR